MKRDEGAALATVLVMLAIMSAFAIVVVDAARFSLRRAANQEGMAQTRWYILGAEGYALRQIERVRKAGADRTIDQSAWQGRPFDFPLDDGAMRITVRDGSNCFNINGLVERTEDGRLQARAAGRIAFARLLDLAGVRTGVALDALAADWIDSDSSPLPGGAEDGAYADRGRRPPNDLIADLGELRSIDGFDAEVMQRIAPFVCVRPDVAPSAININTIVPGQAEVLAMIFGSELTPGVAADLIRARPTAGWASVEDFLGQPRLSGLEIPDSLRAQLAVESRWFVVETDVIRAVAAESAASLVDARGPLHVSRRVLGPGAGRYAL